MEQETAGNSVTPSEEAAVVTPETIEDQGASMRLRAVLVRIIRIVGLNSSI